MRSPGSSPSGRSSSASWASRGVPSDPLPEVTVVTHIVTPYHAEFFDAIRRTGAIDLRVVYLAEASVHRDWRPAHRDHPFVDLGRSGEEGLRQAERWIDASALAVFGHYRHDDGLRWIHRRHEARKP